MRSIEEVDPVFASIDIEAYSSEMTVVGFDVFGLAWLHQFGDKQAVAQSAFTQRYLETEEEPIFGILWTPTTAQAHGQAYSAEPAKQRRDVLTLRT